MTTQASSVLSMHVTDASETKSPIDSGLWAPVSAEELYLAGLFDGVWYRERYPDVGDEDALLHFLAVGDRERRRPSERFDPDWYLTQVPEGLGSAVGPLSHYLRLGRAQGFSPLPPQPEAPPSSQDEDGAASPSTLQTEAPGEVAADAWERLSSYDVYFSALFDGDWYRSEHPELADEPDLLAHFVTHGDAAGWSPSPLFDAGWYRDQPGGIDGAPSALTHYIRKGREEGRSPRPTGRLAERLANSPLVDNDWYRKTYPDAAATGWLPLSHWLEVGRRLDLDPGPWFSARWYRERYGDLMAPDTAPLDHYLSGGEAAGLWPNPVFDPFAYRREHAGLLGDIERPLETWVGLGRAGGDWRLNAFDDAFYVRDNPDVDFEGQTPLTHFLRSGWREGRHPLGPSDGSWAAPAGALTLDLLIDAHGAGAEALSSTIDSLTEQGFDLWNAFISAGGKGAEAVASDRIRVVPARAGGKAARLRALLAQSRADYVIVLDAGDRLTRGALGKVAAALRYDRSDVLYSDEAQPVSALGRPPLQLKPDWSPELLTAYNYFGRLCVIRRQPALKADAFPTLSGEAAEWDLALKMSRRTDSIRRLTETLCIRSPDSDLDRPPPVSRRSADFREALRRHWRALGHDAVVRARREGTFHATWPLARSPKVSIIIPTRDRRELLARVIDGLRHDTAYTDFEIIVVDNMSSDRASLAYLAELQATAQARVVPFEQTFNYSAACNAGAAAAEGELLLFLNNDVEVVSADWLGELVRMAMRPGVGVVGTQLRYPDGVLQHGGVAVGVHLVGLMFKGAPLNDWGVFGSPATDRNWSAIMGACQLVRREVFEAIGGFDEAFGVAASDVMLCLRAGQAGWRTAYAPHAALVHHEGATRGRSNLHEDMQRAAFDIAAMGMAEDPFHHPALDPDLAIPTVRAEDSASGRTRLAQAIADFRRTAPRATRLDLFDIGDVAEAANLPADAIRWRPNPRAVIVDIWGAARRVLDTLQIRPDLHERFPSALSGGPDGAFARWIADEGGAALGLDDAAIAWISQAFALDLGERVEAVYRLDPEAGASAPLGLTPGGRRDLVGWLFTVGARRHGLRREEIWWFALREAEKADASLLKTWRMTPTWQRLHPDALTPLGRRRLAEWVRRTYDAEGAWTQPSQWPDEASPTDLLRLAYQARPEWRHRHPAAFSNARKARDLARAMTADVWEGAAPAELDMALAADLERCGLNIIGVFTPGGPAATLANASETAGVAVQRRGLPVVDQPGATCTPAPLGLEIHDVTVIVMQPEDGFADAHALSGLQPRATRPYTVGYWSLDLDRAPAGWLNAAEHVAEIWTPGEATAEVIQELIDLPVTVVEAHDGVAVRARLTAIQAQAKPKRRSRKEAI